ncbi:hypothetical protein M440DRAFT_225954 [Trichoderma longibrachiatum ATCC 18648]|uniref:Uncharacterized protein n=1 Tax=Trichoderma longibrachiatum ATCC 18648 TaxID=983965 RepID=A0A2T4CBP7_TRILO|nr:hypothetical protein M440DRAFT_225954 [Trichoderma longibrachiatum ATCC 18648]
MWKTSLGRGSIPKGFHISFLSLWATPSERDVADSLSRSINAVNQVTPARPRTRQDASPRNLERTRCDIDQHGKLPCRISYANSYTPLPFPRFRHMLLPSCYFPLKLELIRTLTHDSPTPGLQLPGAGKPPARRSKRRFRREGESSRAWGVWKGIQGSGLGHCFLLSSSLFAFSRLSWDYLLFLGVISRLVLFSRTFSRLAAYTSGARPRFWTSAGRTKTRNTSRRRDGEGEKGEAVMSH